MFMKLSSYDGSFSFPALYGTEKEEEKEMGKTWQRISDERGIPLNDQYFMVRCETTEKMYEFRKRMEKEYGLEWIDAASGGIPYGAGMFINLNSGLMFYCNLGANNLSGPWIGNKAISMDEFVQIAEIYRKHTEKGLFDFRKSFDKENDNIVNGKSFLFFIDRPEQRGWKCLDDPVYELRALDLNLDIMENVHTGHLEETGYAIQVFTETDEQRRIVMEYLNLRNIKTCMSVHDDWACVMNNRSGRTRGYAKIHYCTKEDPVESNTGYNIHWENGRCTGHILFMVLGYVRTKHPELNQIVKGGFVIQTGIGKQTDN